jgi:hypothetical protein
MAERDVQVLEQVAGDQILKVKEPCERIVKPADIVDTGVAIGLGGWVDLRLGSSRSRLGSVVGARFLRIFWC